MAEAAAELHDKYAADIEKLAEWCESNGLKEEARKTRRVLSPHDPYKLYVPVLPDEIGPPKLPDDAPAKVVSWDSKLRKLRREYADDALRNGPASGARAGRPVWLSCWRWTRSRRIPIIEPARRLFGYQKFRDQWRTLYEVKKLRAGFVWSEKFGWLPKAHSAATKRESDTATAVGFRPTRTPSGTPTSARAGTSRPSTT